MDIKKLLVKKNFLILIYLLFLTASNINAQESNIIPGNIIVMLHSDTEAEQLVTSLNDLNGINTGIKLERTLSSSMHIFLFSFDVNNIDNNKMLNAVKTNPMVLIAQFNHTFESRSIPNDTYFPNQWDMLNTGQSGGVSGSDIHATEAWDITTGGLTAQGDTIVVAVIDGGFDLTHQDLSFWKNYHEIPNDSIDNDGNGYIDDVDGWNAGTNTDVLPVLDHGTHVCGTIGAKGNNGIGISGVNWNVKIMPVYYGNAMEANVVVAYSYVMDNRRLYNRTNGAKGAFVVATNSSFGVDQGQPSAYPLWCAMYDSLGSVGILSAAATTNNNYNVDLVGDIPTACPSNWLITVTNTTNTDDKYSTCGFGATTIDLGAPGTAIWSTLPGNTYGGGSTWTGTSMASPHVAGSIALMYSVQCNRFISDYKANPAAMALLVKDSLLSSVDLITSMGSGITASGGRLDLFKSVKSIQNYCLANSIADNGNVDTEFEIKGVYPNPSSKMIKIVYNSNDAVEIIFTDLLGQEIKRVKGDNATRGVHCSNIDVSSLAKGVYFASICNKTKNSNTIKVIID